MSLSIKEVLDRQKAFFATQETKSLHFRMRTLKKLYQLIIDNEEAFYDALKKDLYKSRYEAYMTEIGLTLSEITYFLKNLKKLSKIKRVKTPLTQFMAKSYIYKEPYGVVLIMSPWNYPVLLSLVPLIGAIAAGNCVILKPSETSKNTSNLLTKLINNNFSSDFITVIEGGVEVSQELLVHKFNYIFFTGSSRVGKIVMEAATKHLTPVTLELGGKSPCIVMRDADLELTAKRIVWGKMLNNGQTCVAPDYILVDENIKDELIEKLIKYIKLFSNDRAHFINEAALTRMQSLLDKQKIIYGGKVEKDKLQMEFTLVDEASLDSRLMQEEIFGPILPVLSFTKLDDVIAIINKNKEPLALYLFTKTKEIKDYILKSLVFGGGCINDTIVHLSTAYLPFGGVGISGMGHYHGKASFDTFTHDKSIIERLYGFDLKAKYPPFSKSLKLLKKVLK